MRLQDLFKLTQEQPERYVVKHEAHNAKTPRSISNHVDGRQPKKGHPRSLRQARKQQKLARRAHRFG